MASAFESLLFSAAFAASMAAVMVYGLQFDVGETTGWRMPTGKELKPTTNGLLVTDSTSEIHSVNFNYQNDSVLVVGAADYLNCNTSDPISRFEDGETVFEFDGSGFFYFISGVPDHCKSGQKLVVRVMHPSHGEAPELAPSPVGGGGDWAAPAVNSTTNFSVVSYLVTALAGLFIVVYLFM